jgi:hypothetical protein
MSEDVTGDRRQVFVGFDLEPVRGGPCLVSPYNALYLYASSIAQGFILNCTRFHPQLHKWGLSAFIDAAFRPFASSIAQVPPDQLSRPLQCPISSTGIS